MRPALPSFKTPSSSTAAPPRADQPTLLSCFRFCSRSPSPSGLLSLPCAPWLYALGTGLLLACALFFLAACNDCKRDQECPDRFRCGPGLRCVGRCIPGTSEDCATGSICAPEGNRCIPGSPPDASSSELPPTETPVESAPE